MSRQNNLQLQDRFQLIELFEIYGCLLTKKQQENFSKYYFEDLSLQEIADIHNVSKIAVQDSLKKTIKILNNFEKKLQLDKKINNLKFDNNWNNKQIIGYLKQILKWKQN